MHYMLFITTFLACSFLKLLNLALRFLDKLSFIDILRNAVFGETHAGLEQHEGE